MAGAPKRAPSADKCIICGEAAERVIIDLDTWDIEVVCVPCHVATIVNVFAQANEQHLAEVEG